MPRSSGTQPRPGGRGRRGRRVASMPSSTTDPCACRCRPMTERSSVVLPAPLRPTRVTTSPWPTVRSTSRRACASPYQADSPATSRRRVELSHGGVTLWAAQVGRDDPLVGAHLLVAALGEHGPDCSTVTRSASEPTTCMLWSTSTTVRPARDPLDQRDGAVDVLDAHAGGRLVEQEQPGSSARARASSRARFWPYASEPASTPGPVGEADLLEQVHARGGGTGASASGSARTGSPSPVGEARASSTWSTQRHLVEQAGDLERAGHAEVDDLLRAEPGDVAVAEVDRARGGGQEAGEQVEQGGLAGAVRADQGVHAALGDVEVDALHGGEAAELLGQGAGLEQRRVLGHLHLLVR